MHVLRWRSRVNTRIPLLRVLGGGVCMLVSKSHSTFCYLKDWRSRVYSRIPLPSVLGMGVCGCVCVCLLVTKSYPALCYLKDCSPTKLLCPWNSAGIPEWVAIPFSRGSSSPRDWTLVSCTAQILFCHLSHRISPILLPFHHLPTSFSVMHFLRKLVIWLLDFPFVNFSLQI